MIATLKTLLSPLTYLKAKNSHKFVWDWIIPALFAVLGVLLLLVLPKPLSVLGERGLVYWVNELLQVLIGFYIAALAAVASFDRAALDQLIEGDGVTLKVVRDGSPVDRSLTRRAFISLMFSYLSLLAITLYCMGVAISLLEGNIKLILPAALFYLRLGFVFIYAFLFAQMLSITLVALFYLGDRIHRQTPTPLPPQDIPPGE